MANPGFSRFLNKTLRLEALAGKVNLSIHANFIAIKKGV
jgi:hypothetical protein